MFKQEKIILHKYKKMNLWKGTYDNKFSKFYNLLQNLCNLHHIPIPKLKIYNWEYDYDGDCSFEEQLIRCKNFSVLTLLHEFKHWLDFSQSKKFTINNKDEREYEAIYYSVSRFYSVWPERIIDLEELINLNLNEKTKCKVSCYKNNDPHNNAIIDLIIGEIDG